MIKTTRRYLDTCDCIIEYDWDDSLEASDIVHINPKSVNKCGTHSHLANGQAHFDQIVAEDLARLES